MSQPLLSILIPTVVGREENCTRLLTRLLSSKLEVVGEGWVGKDERFWGIDVDEIQIIGCKDNKEMTIGEKREMLYQKADGLFSVQWDDDDDIADNGIELILKAIKDTEAVFPVDVITYRENCMMNGKYFSSNHSLIYDKWRDGWDGYDFTRSPFYKDVIRTSIAKQVPFPPIRYNEDEQWSYAINPLLQTEHHIDEEIYFYIYNETPHNERYGITQR